MTANVEGMIRAGIDAYRGGNKPEARAFLEKAIELDEYNEDAWMWLSAVVETPEEQRTCLENVLVINPENDKAQQGLKMLGVDTSTDTSQPSDEAVATDEAFESSTPAFIGSDFDEVDEDDNEDWLTVPPTASSSASATFQGEDLSSNDYDDWVAGLNLGGDDELAESTVVEESSNFNLDEVDNMFGSDDLFGDDIVQPTSSPSDEDSFTSGPFGGGDDFGIPTFDEEVTETEPLPKTPAKAPILSPAAENIDSLSFEDSGIGDLLSDDDLIDDHSDYIGGDFVTADHVSQSSYEDLTAEQYFSYIPKDIKATRLPGTNEGSSILMVLGVVVLLILNIGAGVFLALSFGS